MNYDEALLTYVAVGVTFAGFSALVTAVRRQAADRNPHLRIRLRGMVEVALLVALFSILPLSMRAFPVSEEGAWRFCSVLLAIAWPTVFLLTMSRARRAERAGYPIGSVPYVFFLYSITVASAGSLAANSLGAFSSCGAVYLSNLGVLLFVCGIWFIRLIAGIVPGDPPSDGAA
jgi:hypothetical protein